MYPFYFFLRERGCFFFIYLFCFVSFWSLSMAAIQCLLKQSYYKQTERACILLDFLDSQLAECKGESFHCIRSGLGFNSSQSCITCPVPFINVNFKYWRVVCDSMCGTLHQKTVLCINPPTHHHLAC